MSFNSTGNVVDGMINNMAEDGEPRQNLPQDAVEEFKVSNMQFPAEFGLATGGIVQVVTKSGTNALNGSAFEYLPRQVAERHGRLRDREAGVPAPSVRRAALGGPILRDRMHFFGAVERTQVDEFYTVNTGLPQFYSAVEGTFQRPFTRNLYVGRVDYQLSNSQSLFARWAQEQERAECNGCGGNDREHGRLRHRSAADVVRGGAHLDPWSATAQRLPGPDRDRRLLHRAGGHEDLHADRQLPARADQSVEPAA